MGVTRRAFMGGATAAVLASRGRLSPAHAAGRPVLPIPPELRPDAEGRIALAAREGTKVFRPGLTTPTYGYNGDYLGPALRLRRGGKVAVSVDNLLEEPITTHWHGLIVPGEQDGGPHQIIKPGAQWHVDLSIEQPAATLWYHPHYYPTTASLVLKGLAGLLIIDDEEADGLGLPSAWGVDDIPVVIQDRRLTDSGEIFERFNLTAVTTGYVGDMPLVNGAHQPVARTAQGFVRLRLLNGSNARSYRLAASDGRDLFVIASDGGLLAEPVALKELVMAAGERFELVVDARDGTAFDLVTLPVEHSPIMRLPPFHQPLTLVTLEPTGAAGGGTLPDRLASLPALPGTLPQASHRLDIDMTLDDKGMSALKAAGIGKVKGKEAVPPDVVAALTRLIVDGPVLPEAERLAANGINGMPYALKRPGVEMPRQTPLRWVIGEGDDTMLHPIHLHGCQFRIVRHNGKAPQPHLAGWKDTVPIFAGGETEILVTFPFAAPPAAPYMAHCHILEHEDSGMMTQFSVA